MSDEKREMNLFEFIRLIAKSIAKFFKWILNVLLKTFRLAIQYYWIVIICALAGFGIAFWISQDENVKHKAEVTILFSPELRPQIKDGLQIYFNTLVGGNAEELLPPMTHDMAKNIRKLQVFNIIDCKFDSIPDYVDYKNSAKSLVDTFNVIMPDRLLLRLKAKGSSDFSLYQESITRFFESQPDIVLADRQRKITEARNLMILTKDVARLDSFATYDYLEKPSNLSLEMGRPILISERKQEIYSHYLLAAINKQTYLARRVALTPNIINFQTDFVVTRYPKIYMWIFGIIIGGIIGLLIALCVKYKKNISQYLKEK